MFLLAMWQTYLFIMKSKEKIKDLTRLAGLWFEQFGSLYQLGTGSKMEYSYLNPNLHMCIFSLTLPHLLTPATLSPSFKSFPQPPQPGLNLARHLSAFYLCWWSQPLKQPRRHPHPSPTFLSVSLPRACTMALLGRVPRTVFVRSPLRPHPPFIDVCGGTVSEYAGLCVCVRAHCFSSSREGGVAPSLW